MILEQAAPMPRAPLGRREMETIKSLYFGEIPRDSSSEIHVPLGLPGFESETCLVAIEIPEQRPLVYLQSAFNPELCFLTMPANAITKEFSVELSEDERATILLSPTEPLVMGENVIALAILFPVEGAVQVNMAAPLVINLQRMIGVQRLPESAAENRRLEQRGASDWVPVC